ncbi:hypothetical protein ACIBG8_14390 [Nonomuraea sp. NPDC050556]|uniref:hypothetical protein n=1 Tax=Nonomuraea sp. NPDC050556 TaxID=3364369 RepID=UPI00378A1950
MMDRIRVWARELRYFRFCRAYGGHANDGDHLLAALRVDTRGGLLEVMDTLGIPVVTDVSSPVPGQAYTAAEYARFSLPIPGFPDIAQPGHVEIAGHRAHVWCHGELLRISVADTGDPYSVTDAAVAAARSIEPLLPAARVVDPPQDDRNCVCPRYYPEIWA